MCLPRIGRIIHRTGDMGLVESEGRRFDAALMIVPSAGDGDWVMIHAGVALAILTSEQARERIDLMTRLRDSADTD